MVNPAGFRYCGRCGHPLETPPARAPEDMGTAQTMFVGNVDEGLAAIEHDDEDEATLSKPFGISNLAQDPPNLGGSGQPASTSQSRAKLVMLGTDGQPVGERILAVGETLEIGRTAGPPWDDDAYLDPQHGALTLVDDGVQVVDFDSVNGFFVKLHGRMEIQNGDQFRVGQELLRYEDLPEPTPTNDGTERMGSPNPGYWGRLCVLVDPQRASMAYPIEDEGVTIGREQGEITFPQDGYVSGRHCRLMGDDEGIYIEDLGSSNGTYMRVRDGQTLPYGSLVLIGQKLFQIERLA